MKANAFLTCLYLDLKVLSKELRSTKGKKMRDYLNKLKLKLFSFCFLCFVKEANQIFRQINWGFEHYLVKLKEKHRDRGAGGGG